MNFWPTVSVGALLLFFCVFPPALIGWLFHPESHPDPWECWRFGWLLVLATAVAVFVLYVVGLSAINVAELIGGAW